MADKLKVKSILIRVFAGICLPLALFALLYYFNESYLQFISYASNADWLGYFTASGLRLICRIGYPVSYVALLFRKKWGAWLLIGVWLCQLIPSTIYFLYAGEGLNPDHLVSALTFLGSLAIIHYCKEVLTGKMLVPLCIFIFAAIAFHSIVFFETLYR